MYCIVYTGKKWKIFVFVCENYFTFFKFESRSKFRIDCLYTPFAKLAKVILLQNKSYVIQWKLIRHLGTLRDSDESTVISLVRGYLDSRSLSKNELALSIAHLPICYGINLEYMQKVGLKGSNWNLFYLSFPLKVNFIG